ncbi:MULTISPECIES: RNA polymerase sigma factor [Pseudomonadota]|uniref:RNA polymerase subunit sigma-24 n=2 Tax=Pseudomonadota TaxID=1224 RepID=A0A656Q8G2_9BURK|nr:MULTISPECIES: RNA polymerase sigma factor [Pseudomonadota]AAP06949.1 hypothetical protein [Pseudomonas sp. WBC-3]KAK42484.1 RNA polymerase subunit sigma-24 [Caballeronia jiangsuensis]BBQ03167.1 RNA polymerase sigma factor [Burkholderia sp. SFA1]AHZ78140.1 RNA polymerase sigma-70 factor [Pseudomonas putida]AHZ78296.1 RNA polymerase sigma-71 factor [Pseudomonas putida]
MSRTDLHRQLDGLWRIESAKVVAKVAHMTRDVGVAEEIAQDALLAALETWPGQGLPDNPGAWLMTTAKHRAIDWLRRQQLHAANETDLSRTLDDQMAAGMPDVEAWMDDAIGDDLLRLVFTACHPVLSPEARVALTLRLLGGLTTDEIARAFLVPEATLAQRIVRAKRTLGEARVPFEAPRADELAERLDAVLEVVYLIFNEGYAATAGDDWMRPALCNEALRLGRMVAELMPAEPEVHGLVALMEIQASRLHARTGPGGEPVLLMDQDRTRWDRLLIRRGLAALARAEGLLAVQDRGHGPYALQAAIAACHARAVTPGATDWSRIVALYDGLLQVMPSPVVALNRAVAVGQARGPAEALALVDGLALEPRFQQYHLLPSVRADLLQRLGRRAEARAAYLVAADLARNRREEALLRERAAACHP